MIYTPTHPMQNQVAELKDMENSQMQCKSINTFKIANVPSGGLELQSTRCTEVVVIISCNIWVHYLPTVKPYFCWWKVESMAAFTWWIQILQPVTSDVACSSMCPAHVPSSRMALQYSLKGTSSSTNGSNTSRCSCIWWTQTSVERHQTRGTITALEWAIESLC